MVASSAGVHRAAARAARLLPRASWGSSACLCEKAYVGARTNQHSHKHTEAHTKFAGVYICCCSDKRLHVSLVQIDESYGYLQAYTIACTGIYIIQVQSCGCMQAYKYKNMHYLRIHTHA